MDTRKNFVVIITDPAENVTVHRFETEEEAWNFVAEWESVDCSDFEVAKLI